MRIVKYIIFIIIWLACSLNGSAQTFMKTYGGIDEDEGNDVQETIDGGYVIFGSHKVGGLMDGFIIKTNNLGDTVWTHTFGGNGDDLIYSGQQTADSGFICAGETQSFGSGISDFWVVKFSSSGNLQWSNAKMGDILLLEPH